MDVEEEVGRMGRRQLGGKLGFRMAQGASKSDRSHVGKSVAEVTEVRIGCKHSSGSTVLPRPPMTCMSD
jgi:hypothetical protein